MRGVTRAALLALAVLLLAAAVPTAVGWATAPTRAAGPCRPVAFMSMVGVERDCR
ncbi:hypothetical protein [Streptomyces sp. NPDC012888]|uniref:hypothetical protein n=1 Tax=Streptomyces sp. NPDC012888 TaxID=3364855 RepID=UPI0036852999